MRQQTSSGRIGLFLVIFGLLLAACAFALLAERHYTISPPGNSPGTHATPLSSAKVSTQAVDTYSVPADLPKYITIPAINVVKTRIFSLGTLANGEIATPSNTNDAGWYKASSKPGQAGVMFMYGHISSWQANGVFYNLKKLRAGDAVTITRGDNKTFAYEVVSSKTYPHDHVDMHAVLSPIDKKAPGLNLMTCAGKVIKNTSEFSERLVVFTKQINP